MDKLLKIKIKLLDENAKPLKYQTNGSSGMDLYSNLESARFLGPGERILVPTGISIALPEHVEAQVRTRSGLASKSGIIVLNSPGTIDSDYRGEIKVLLYNASNEGVFITPGMRVAQLVISKFVKIGLEFVDSLPESLRGEGGFGSTGVY